jgi:proline iminopeptidase
VKVAVTGAELWCTRRGRGPICLCPSAIGTAPYERQLGALGEALTLIFVDLRGSGQSTGAASDLTFDVLAEDLEAVRRHLGVERLAVLGHSILGALTIEYARRCPNRVSHVITVGTPPHGDMAEIQQRATAFFEEDASPARKQRLRDNLATLPPDAGMGEYLFAQTPLRFFDATFDARPLFEGAISRPEILTHIMSTLTSTWDVRGRPAGVAPLRVPLLVALGRHDYIVPWDLWTAVAPELPTATVQVFDRSGHQPFVEEPARFASTLTAWMTRP